MGLQVGDLVGARRLVLGDRLLVDDVEAEFLGLALEGVLGVDGGAGALVDDPDLLAATAQDVLDEAGQDRGLAGPEGEDREGVGERQGDLLVDVADHDRHLVLVGDRGEDDVRFAHDRHEGEGLVLGPLLLHLDGAGVGGAVVVGLEHEPAPVDRTGLIERGLDGDRAVAEEAGVGARLRVEEPDRDRVLRDPGGGSTAGDGRRGGRRGRGSTPLAGSGRAGGGRHRVGRGRPGRPGSSCRPRGGARAGSARRGTARTWGGRAGGASAGPGNGAGAGRGGDRRHRVRDGVGDCRAVNRTGGGFGGGRARRPGDRPGRPDSGLGVAVLADVAGAGAARQGQEHEHRRGADRPPSDANVLPSHSRLPPHTNCSSVTARAPPRYVAATRSSCSSSAAVPASRTAPRSST